MARLTVGLVFGFVVGVVAGAAAGLHAQAEDVETVAAEAGVNAEDLAGAVNTTGVGPREYLVGVGELVRAPTPPVPVPSVWARVACIEAKESGGANVSNARGSGAGGVLQYMPSTFARGARELGHPEWSLWVPDQARAVAAHDLLLGRRGQWTVSGC